MGMTLEKERKIFYICMIVLPLLQFCIFYVYSKVQSVLLAFQDYSVNMEGLGYNIGFSGFSNFATAFSVIKSNFRMIENSLIMYAADLIVGMGLALIFSYYITKKYPGSGVFKVFLFMPQIISGVVFGILFRYMVSEVYMSLTGAEQGLLRNEQTQFGTIMFYNIWLGFGARVLITSSAMSGIDTSIVESASLDGCTPVKEFFHITLPLIFPTFATLIILGVTGIFTNQRGVHTLLENSATTGANFGWYLYYQTLRSDLVVTDAGRLNYSQLSALGLVFSIIVFVGVTAVKKVINKYGPSVD